MVITVQIQPGILMFLLTWHTTHQACKGTLYAGASQDCSKVRSAANKPLLRTVRDDVVCLLRMATWQSRSGSIGTCIPCTAVTLAA